MDKKNKERVLDAQSSAFFKFSHRDLEGKVLTNIEQYKIVECVFEQIVANH